MTWTNKVGQKGTSYSRDFCPFFLSLFFLPFFLLSISCSQRQDSSMGESLISTSMVAEGQLNQRHTAMGIELDILGFGNLLSSWNTGRKRIQRSEKIKREREMKFKVRFLGCFRIWRRKKCNKTSVLKSEPFHKMRKLLDTFLMVLPRSWNSCTGVWENCVWMEGKKRESIWKEKKALSHAGLNWHLCEWHLFEYIF